MFTKKIFISLFLFFASSFADPLPPDFVQKVGVLVLGSGAGGLTSAIYLARGGVDCLVLEGNMPGGAITQSHGVQNWPGELDISGFDLMDKIRLQAEKNGVSIEKGEVVKVDFSTKPFSFVIQSIYDPSKKRQILADACIIATGSKARQLNVAGEAEYSSKGVYTCAICDGSLYKDKTVAVVGGGDSAILEAMYLSGIAKKVYVLVRKDQFKGLEKNRINQMIALPNVTILYEVTVEKIKGKEGSVDSLEILHQSGKTESLSVDAVFLAIGSVPNSQVFASSLQLDANGYIVLKNHLETSIPGVFAVGDVTDPLFKQAVSAAGDGAKAAIQAQLFLSSKKITEGKEEKVKTFSKEKLPSARVIDVKNLTQLREILKTSQLPVIVDFYATWCAPCRYLSDFIDAWAKDLEGKVLICKVDVDHVDDITSSYNIRSMPTFVRIDKDGKEVTRKSGAQEIISYMNSLK